MTVIFAMPGNEHLAARLAALSDGSLGRLQSRKFPDGETYLRFQDAIGGRSVAIACTLDRPDDKIPALLFAADAARELGARRVGLVAPYLCYLRQDCRFQSGEAVTSRSFAALLSQHFDWLVTLDPHLHRYGALGEVYSIPARAVHAAPVIADWIKAYLARPVLIGPDAESQQWIEAVAEACGAGWVRLDKIRKGDSQVSETPVSVSLAGRTPVLLDDIISSGATVLETLRQLPPDAGPATVIAIHAVCRENVAQSLARAGAQLVTTNSIPNPAAEIDIVPLLAESLRELA